MFRSNATLALVLSVCSVSIIGNGCGGSTSNPDGGDGGHVGMLDGGDGGHVGTLDGGDAGHVGMPDGGDAGHTLSCIGGSTSCTTDAGTVCVNLQENGFNCGACGKACPSGEVCSAGSCNASCLEGTSLCSGDAGPYCADLSTDPGNCSSCGSACPSGEVCSGGSCNASCLSGTTLCGTDGGASGAGAYCADLSTDEQNCGGCSKPCPSGEVCSGGSCNASCLAGTTLCGGLDGGKVGAFCSNLNTDDRNCGKCGTVCPEGQICNGSGKCATSCLSSESLCGTLCTNTKTDPLNCGGCAADGGGTVCAAGELCSNGSCNASCLSPTTLCGADGGTPYCTNTKTNQDNCGGCGKICPSGEFCNGSGQCAASCLAGENLCGGLCTNTKTDPANCGGCANDGGVRCPSGQVCASGTCATSCLGSENLCNGICSDPNTDNQNCGGCNKPCQDGQACVGGTCSCPSNQTFCSSSQATGGIAGCYNTASDNGNCGACGDSCGAGTVCNGAGHCATTCLPSELQCGGICTNPLTDALNCGGCGNPCAGGEVCSGGTCSETCASGFTTCGASSSTPYCASTNDDVNNCGGCGQVCDTGTNCQNGQCVCPLGDVDCNAGEVVCGNGRCGNGSACTNTLRDPNNCSTTAVCGHSAGGAMCSGSTPFCTGGHCEANCTGAGAAVCTVTGGATQCVDTLSDNNNCGACGQVCDFGANCVTGTCTCPGGEVDCTVDAGTLCADGHCGGAACTNTLQDPNNCSPSSACGEVGGTVCTGNTPFCVNGACQPACTGSGEQICGSLCVNTLTDSSHCGGCTNQCDNGASCTTFLDGGVCACRGGQTDCSGPDGFVCDAGNCGGSCTNTQTDPNNCGPVGACAQDTGGVFCTGSQPYCQGGQCQAQCTGISQLCAPGGGGALQCFNLQTDNQNCGVCGNNCDNGATCTASGDAGVCQCPSGQVDCTATGADCPSGNCHNGSYCTNTANDPNNCSTQSFCGDAGGAVCSLDAGAPYCTNGVCQASCTFPSEICEIDAGLFECVNTQLDPSNCGGCGWTNPSDICAAGGLCVSPLNPLGVGGRNPRAAKTTFGTKIFTGLLENVRELFGHHPAASQRGGHAVLPHIPSTFCGCPLMGNGSPEANCNVDGGQVCIDTQTDSNNCGACNNICGVVGGPNEGKPLCQEGACVAGCGGGTTTCLAGTPGAYCANLFNDPNNCGTCADVCSGSFANGSFCDGGNCFCPPNSGTAPAGAQQTCGGSSCIDLSTDPNNCGVCAPGPHGDAGVCEPGATCDNGACTCPTVNGFAEQNCGGSCIDVSTNSQNCGTCSTVCGVGAKAGLPVCQGGRCVAACGGSTSFCDAGLDGVSAYCANENTDPSNCGGCGIACDPGAVCNGALGCSCPTGQLDCSGATQCASPLADTCGGNSSCIDTGSDANNCGGCGVICDLGATCSDGGCTCPGSGPGSEVDCTTAGLACATNHCGSGSACTNTMSNPKNCSPSNECGNAGGTICDAGFCLNGGCATTCTAPFTICGPSDCVNEQSDTRNCGACNNVCDNGANCADVGADGGAQCECPSGSIDCGGAVSPCTTDNCGGSCTNPSADPNNCGGCGNVCTGGACFGGTECVCPLAAPNFCPTGGATDGVCVDLFNDPSNCGSCGTVCDTGASCSAGICICAAGSSDCSSGVACGSSPQDTCDSNINSSGFACIDTQSDPSNCGGCGIACDTGATCSGGVCSCAAGSTDCDATLTCASPTADTCGTGYACAATGTDDSNCGGCGTICIDKGSCAGTCCVSGGCVCSDGQVQSSVALDGACTDTCDCAGGSCYASVGGPASTDLCCPSAPSITTGLPCAQNCDCQSLSCGVAVSGVCD